MYCLLAPSPSFSSYLVILNPDCTTLSPFAVGAMSSFVSRGSWSKRKKGLLFLDLGILLFSLRCPVVRSLQDTYPAALTLGTHPHQHATRFTSTQQELIQKFQQHPSRQYPNKSHRHAIGGFPVTLAKHISQPLSSPTDTPTEDFLPVPAGGSSMGHGHTFQQGLNFSLSHGGRGLFQVCSFLPALKKVAALCYKLIILYIKISLFKVLLQFLSSMDSDI